MFTIAPERILPIDAEAFMRYFYADWIESTGTRPTASDPDENANFWQSTALNVISDSQAAMCEYRRSAGVIATEWLEAKHIATDDKTIRIDTEFMDLCFLRIMHIQCKTVQYHGMGEFYVLFMQSSKSPDNMIPFVAFPNTPFNTSLGAMYTAPILQFRSPLSEGWSICVDYSETAIQPVVNPAIDLNGFFSALAVDQNGVMDQLFKAVAKMTDIQITKSFK